MRTLNSVFVKQPLSLVCDMAWLTIQSLMIFFFQDREGINENTMHSRCKFQWSMLQVHSLFSCENDPIMTHDDTYDDTYISSYWLIKDSMSLVAVKSLDKTTLALYPCELCQGMMFIGIRAVGTSAGGNYPDWIL